MNPEVKKDWVKALRLGDYRQGTGYLCKDGEFCCLGVLADLAVKAGVIEPGVVTEQFDAVWHGSAAILAYGGGAIPDAKLLPVAVVDWAGLDAHSPVAGGDPLVELNDLRAFSFKEIADVIEKDDDL